jgi:hypothetical protein
MFVKIKQASNMYHKNTFYFILYVYVCELDLKMVIRISRNISHKFRPSAIQGYEVDSNLNCLLLLVFRTTGCLSNRYTLCSPGEG